MLHESDASTTIRDGDMAITCPAGPNKGKPVRARGLWQFTECYHPEVSDAEAYDMASSTTLALPLLRNEKTCRNQFSTCDQYYREAENSLAVTN